VRQTFIIRFDKDELPEPSCQFSYELLCEYLLSIGRREVLDVLPKMSRVWMEVATNAAGEAKCMGIATIAQVWDVANFHCEDDRSRARLIQRISTVLEESVGERTMALVHISPQVEKEWSGLLEEMKAERANRWLIPTSKPLQEGGQNVLRPEQHPAELHEYAGQSDSSTDHKAESGS